MGNGPVAQEEIADIHLSVLEGPEPVGAAVVAPREVMGPQVDEVAALIVEGAEPAVREGRKLLLLDPKRTVELLHARRLK